MARLPVKTRLTLGFALVMALVLAGVGLFLYFRTQSDLDRQIDRELAARTAGVVAITRDDGDDFGDPVQAPLERVDPGGLVQVLGPSGDVIDSTSTALAEDPLLPKRVLGRIEVESEAEETVDVEVNPIGPVRLQAARIIDDKVPYTLIVGASLEERDQALASLRSVILIGFPIALALSTLVAYLVAAGALAPVDRMRRKAAVITDNSSGDRLPVPPTRDEISALGETLNGMIDRLQLAVEREKRFVADASHELRTPLSIMKAEIDLALDGRDDEDSFREALASVGEETARLQRLSEDLLVIARSEGGSLPLKLEEMPASELLGWLVERYVSSPEKAGRIGVEADNSLLVSGDRLRLQQAIINLVDNALRYSDGEVLVSIDRNDGALVFAVSDRGPGVVEALSERLFERFSRGSRESDGEGGAGLGLAIVETIANAHGGEVGVSDRPGGGATFWFTVPDRPA